MLISSQNLYLLYATSRWPLYLLLPPKNPFFPPLFCQLLSSLPPFSIPPVLMRGKIILTSCKNLFYPLLPSPSYHLHSISTSTPPSFTYVGQIYPIIFLSTSPTPTWLSAGVLIYYSPSSACPPHVAFMSHAPCTHCHCTQCCGPRVPSGPQHAQRSGRSEVAHY